MCACALLKAQLAARTEESCLETEPAVSARRPPLTFSPRGVIFLGKVTECRRGNQAGTPVFEGRFRALVWNPVLEPAFLSLRRRPKLTVPPQRRCPSRTHQDLSDPTCHTAEPAARRSFQRIFTTGPLCPAGLHVLGFRRRVPFSGHGGGGGFPRIGLLSGAGPVPVAKPRPDWPVSD